MRRGGTLGGATYARPVPGSGIPSRILRMAALMRIERWDPRRDGPLSEAALRQKIEARGYRVSSSSWPAGAIVAGQAEMHERLDAVVSGLMKLTVDGESAILTPGDMVYVPLGAVRRIEVVGASPLHCLDGVYAGH